MVVLVVRPSRSFQSNPQSISHPKDVSGIVGIGIDRTELNPLIYTVLPENGAPAGPGFGRRQPQTSPLFENLSAHAKLPYILRLAAKA